MFAVDIDFFGIALIGIVIFLFVATYFGEKAKREEAERKRKVELEKRLSKGEDINQIKELEHIKQIDRDKGEKLRMEAKLGYDGIGLGFEHDDREQGGKTVEQRLRKLANLRSQNLITEAEYQQRKREILKEI